MLRLSRGLTTLVGRRTVVTLSYAELSGPSTPEIMDKILEAYGPDGLGALTVKDIPDYVEARKALLPLAHELAHLPEDVKLGLEDEHSMFNAGWSHGKEKMGDEPDYSKGSFYANPLFDDPGSDELKAQHPYFYPPNIWPDDNLPALEPAFKHLGSIMYQTSVLLTVHIDALIKHRLPTYNADLHKHIASTHKIKGRLLYYFPTDKTDSEDSWIGWHNDSGMLTTLTSDMFVDDDTGEQIDNPDPAGGLWIVDRHGDSVKVDVPKDEMIIQAGECLQIVSGGLLVATPHAVRASKSPDRRCGRATFPVFVDTEMGFKLVPPPGVSPSDVLDSSMQSKVPPLGDRWVPGQDFATFLGDTFKQYYEWATKK